MKDTAFHRFVKQFELAGRRLIIAVLNRKKQRPITTLPLSLPEAPTFLFLRQDRYGDAIISTPIIAAIAKKYPMGKFIVLLGENNKDIAPLLPVHAETVVYKKKLGEDIAMLRELRKRTIDVLIDMTDNASATSSIIAAMVSATYTVGIDKENAETYNVRVPRIDRGKYHVSRRTAELLRPFGIDPATISLRPVLNVPSEKTAGRIGLNISGRQASRCLPVETSARIAQLVADEEVCRELLIFGQPSQRQEVEEIVTMAGSPKVQAAPITTTFAEFARTLGTCEFLLSPDTAAVHIGSAFATPMVVFFNTWPVTLHYWTPVEVPFEMIVKDSIHTLAPEEALAAFRGLVAKTRKDEVLA